MSPARPPVPRRPASPQPREKSARELEGAAKRSAKRPAEDAPSAADSRLLAPLAPTVTVAPRRPAVVSTGSEARFAERARAHRARTLRRVVWTASGTAVVGLLAWLLLWSPVLALDPELVVVTGAGTVVRTGDVDAVVDGVDGVPLPRLDTLGLRAAVLDVPGVRDARVTRAWPRGLTIALVAREPVAAVPDGERVQLLDVEGVAVGRAKKAPDGLPLVDVPVGDARTLAAVLGVLQALPAELGADVKAVAAQTQDTVTMELRDGARVDWGSADETELKAAVLHALRTAKKSQDATWFDVSAPTLPVTKS